MYLDLMVRVLLGTIYGDRSLDPPAPFVTPDMILNGKFWPEKAHTMIGYKRLTNIKECFESVIKDKIEGDLIETGVWRGGACIFMNAINKAYNEKRTIFVADSFEGLPKPDGTYEADKDDKHYTKDELAISVERVRQNFKAYGLLDENVFFIKGFFKDTLHKAPIRKLAILRLDGDMYQSTIEALNSLYHKVSIGGYVIIDDYKLKPCRKAVTDFRKKYNITEVIREIDQDGVYWRVTEQINKD